MLVIHALRGEGFDASEDGTGRGTPIVPVVAGTICKDSFSGGAGGRPEGAANGHFVPVAIQAGALRENLSSGPGGIGVQENIAYTLEARAEVQAIAFNLRGREGGAQLEVDPTGMANIRAADGGSSRTMIAFSAKDHGADAVKDITPTLRAGGDAKSHANSGNWMTAQIGMQVRRLTPVECARLQGFPDDYLSSVRINGKPPADGPMYKALGNSMAVPVMSWVGRRIQMLEDIMSEISNTEAA